MTGHLRPLTGVKVDPTHPYGRGLIGAWLCNEGAGSGLIDSSLFGNDGVLTNMDVPNAWKGSSQGHALDFDGVDDFVSLGNSLDFAVTTGITLSCGLFQDTEQDNKGIVSSWLPPFSWELRKGTGTNELQFVIRDEGDATQTARVSGVIPPGTWAHIVCTWQAGFTVRIFVDGLLRDEGPIVAGPLWDPGHDIDIGRREGTAGTYADIRIRDVMLWNRGMANSEVQRLHALDLTELFV